MKTHNSKHPVYAYLLSNLKDVETIFLEYGDTVENTVQARLKWTLETFRKEYMYPENIRRYGSEQKVFEQWLMGVPSALHIAIYYSDIIDLAKEWGTLPLTATEKQEERICENWYNFITNKFFTLCRRNKVL